MTSVGLFITLSGDLMLKQVELSQRKSNIIKILWLFFIFLTDKKIFLTLCLQPNRWLIQSHQSFVPTSANMLVMIVFLNKTLTKNFLIDLEEKVSCFKLGQDNLFLNSQNFQETVVKSINRLSKNGGQKDLRWTESQSRRDDTPFEAIN